MSHNGYTAEYEKPIVVGISLMLLDWHRTVFCCTHATGSRLDGGLIILDPQLWSGLSQPGISLAQCFPLRDDPGRVEFPMWRNP
jgi:hypothetical protein